MFYWYMGDSARDDSGKKDTLEVPFALEFQEVQRPGAWNGMSANVSGSASHDSRPNK